MYCPSIDNVFIRADGCLSCWCDYGSTIKLVPYNEAKDYAKDVYWGPEFGKIRTAIQKQEIPFPAFCTKCISLQMVRKYSFNPMVIRLLNVEPTILCKLRCSACTAEFERKNIYRGNHVMRPDQYTKILTDLLKSNIQINMVDFVGNGEPYSSKYTNEMIIKTRLLYPDTLISLHTNANHYFDEEYTDAGLDRISFAIDGIDEKSYNKYRRNGNITMALNFMQKFCASANNKGRNIHKIWKYILFEHNDTPEHILSAVDIASKFGIDELSFVITTRGPKSRKIIDATQLNPILKQSRVTGIRKYLVKRDRYFLYKHYLARLRSTTIFKGVLQLARNSILKKRYFRQRQSAAPQNQDCLVVSCSYFMPDLFDISRGIRLLKKMEKTKDKRLPFFQEFIKDKQSYFTEE